MACRGSGVRIPSAPPQHRARDRRGVDNRGARTSRCRGQSEQSTATARAARISRMRVSRRRPRRWTRTATETLSTESRFTAERRGTGSSSTSRTTSLTSPLIVVQGCHERPTVSRDEDGVAREDGDRPASGLGHLAAPHLPARGEHRQDVAAARRNDPRSPHSSGSSIGCSSYAAQLATTSAERCRANRAARPSSTSAASVLPGRTLRASSSRPASTVLLRRVRGMPRQFHWSAVAGSRRWRD